MSENNKNQGFIVLNRSIQDHWIWTDKPFAWGQAWSDMIMLANYKDNLIVIDGKLTTVKRGEHITSLRKLGEKWGWSTTKVKNFLDTLTEQKMITYKSNSKKTVYKIVNYDAWQGSSLEESNTDITQKKFRNKTEIKQKKFRNKQTTMINNDKTMINNDKQIYGEFGNVFLTDKEIKKLQTRLPNSYKDLIERLSAYIAQSGKKYKSHYATILNWSRRDKETKEIKQEKSNSSRYENDEDYLNELLGVSNE